MPALAVHRARLNSLLDLAVRQRLTLVIAPPGYGKTVLLAQWTASRSAERVRWLTLSAEHNDPGRFARDLCEALAGGPRAQRILSRAGFADRQMGPAFLGALRAELEELPPTTLVLDDLHLLTSAVLLDELATLIDRAPRSFRCVAATQVDPPIGYSRMQWSDLVVELRQEDLAFTRGEATDLVVQLSGRDLTAAQIDALVTRTEGWALGLQLAAISLRGRTDVDDLVETLSGVDRHVSDYLTEHVLSRQSEAVRRFLLCTSVLRRMSGPLCDHILRAQDGQALIEELDRTSMFVSTLDARRTWFRYHELLRSLLRDHLHDEDPALEQQLLHLAAEWHIARDDFDAGVGYLLDAGDWDKVFDAAFTHGGTLLIQGQAASVARWIAGVPSEAAQNRVDVLLLQAGATIVGGGQAAAHELLDAIDASRGASPAELVVADLLRSHRALQQGAHHEALFYVNRVLGAVDEIDEQGIPNILGLTRNRADILAAARLARGSALLYGGDDAEARRALSSAVEGSHAAWHVSALSSFALLEAWSGGLRAAEQLGRQALGIAQQLGIGGLLVTFARIAVAHVALDRHQLDDAAALLDEVAGGVNDDRRRVVAAMIAIERAALAAAKGDALTGLDLLTPRSTRSQPPMPPVIIARRAAIEARLLMMNGDLERAEEILGRVGECDRSEVAVAATRLAVERGDLREAQELVDHWPDGPEPRASLERGVWLAAISHLLGDEASERSALAAVVDAAEREGNIGVFRSAGDFVLGPLRALYRTEPTPFLRTVVDLVAGEGSGRMRPVKELVEQLTDREYVVLAMLPTRLSSVEIAERLGISLNTVKTHLKHLYRKLGVAGRSEAVAEAERLRLL